MPEIGTFTIETAINWWDMVPAVIGALLGAAAAGVPSYLIAKAQSKETLERDANERARSDKHSASKVFSKLAQMTNEILDLRLQIERMLERPVADGERFPNQRCISVIVGHGEDTAHFDAGELAIFVNEHDVGLINDLELLRRRRNALLIQLGEYRARKIAHAALLSETTSIGFDEDGIANLRIPKERFPKIQFEEAQLESLITPLIEFVREESRNCIVVAEKFNASVDRIFNDGVQKFDTTRARSVLMSFGDVVPHAKDPSVA